MSSPICISGLRLEDVTRVADYLLHYEEFCRALASGDSDTPSVTPSEGKRALHIDTKYYTADLEVSCEVVSETDGSVSHGCECCILVVSSSEEELQEELHPHLKGIGSHALNSNVDIRILVVLKTVANSEIVDLCRSNRVMWTLDNSFEYIEIDTASPAKGYNEREKDGLPRLMEALHTNMWTTMERLDPLAKNNQGNAPDSVKDTVFSMPLLPQKTSDNSSAVTTKSSESDARKTEDIDLPLGYKNMLTEGDEDDKIWDNFTSTIEAAKQLREEALGGNLSDVARRKRAADIAMQMCAMMDMSDDSDED